MNPTRSNGHPSPSATLARRWILPIKPPPPINPALMKQAEERAEDAQNRIADRITAFSGSMAFVYLHIIWFSCWIGFGVEKYPYGLLTMILSLEAIFLSTFVMISQNRAEAKHQVVADQQWTTVQEEDRQNKQLLVLSNEQDRQNKELLTLSRQTLDLTKDVRALASKAREDTEKTSELLSVSQRTLSLIEEIHTHAGAGKSTHSGSTRASGA